MEKNLKAVCSNRIYLTKTSRLFSECMETLKYVIPSTRPNARPEIINDIVFINNNVFSIPVGRMDLIPESYEIKDNRLLVPIDFPEPKFDLRPDQIEVLDQVSDNCLINAKPGWGKTFTALYIAKKLGQKTLIVTHNLGLRDQWLAESKKIFGVTAGVIGAAKEFIDAPVVVTNTQTFVNRIDKYREEFGTIICDEVHRVPSTTFKKIIDGMPARYKIGLSATIGRKDGKHVIIPDYFSSNVIKPEGDPALKPTVYCVYTDLKLNTKIPHWVLKVSELCENPEYLKLITDIVNIKVEQNRSVLCVADRVEFLNQCTELVPQSAVVTGATKEREDIHKDILHKVIKALFGSTSIYKEGISINVLDTLILGGPINNKWLLEQLIGRVTRQHPGKADCEVWDIVLKDPTSKKQFSERVNFYMSKGYKIVDIK